jgi:hypothetical protein
VQKINNIFTGFTAMVGYMGPIFLLALFERDNFSNFCPLPTFDGKKCVQALPLQLKHLTFICSLLHQ